MFTYVERWLGMEEGFFTPSIKFVLLIIGACMVASMPASFAVAHAFHGTSLPASPSWGDYALYIAGLLQTAAFVAILETAAVGFKVLTIKLPSWSWRLTAFSWLLIAMAVLANYSQGSDLYMGRGDLTGSLAAARSEVFGIVLTWAMAGLVPVILGLDTAFLVKLMRVRLYGETERIPLSRRIRAWWDGGLALTDTQLRERLETSAAFEARLAELQATFDRQVTDIQTASQSAMTAVLARLDATAAQQVEMANSHERLVAIFKRVTNQLADDTNAVRASQATLASHLAERLDEMNGSIDRRLQVAAAASATVNLYSQPTEDRPPMLRLPQAKTASQPPAGRRALVEVSDEELLRWATPADQGGDGLTMSAIQERLGGISRGAARSRVAGARERLGRAQGEGA